MAKQSTADTLEAGVRKAAWLMGLRGLYSPVGGVASVFGYKLKAPVFVIGTGRCGTTLLVRLLNTHEQLVGFPGEANEFWHPKSYPYARKSVETAPFVEDPERFTEISLANWPAGHDQKIQKTFTGYGFLASPVGHRTLFVKSAMISFMIPQVLSLFPDARFIHIYRNGPSVVESWLKKDWFKYEDYFENEMEYKRHCAKYWNDCIMEIEKRKEELALVQKGAFLEFSYESLCENPRKLMNDIAQLAGVDPDRYGYDVANIVSTNYKVGDYTQDDTWAELLEAMSPGMELKGYQA